MSTYGPSGRSAWLDIDWREHQRWIEVDGSAVNVIDLGPTEGAADGVPIVWIHGLAGSWQNWLENLPYFARTRRCVALDLPGFGASPMPEQPISIAGYARTVDALLRELGIPHAAVVGNSMGGFVGAEIAISFPTWVSRLVLVSAAGITAEHARFGRLVPLLRNADRVAKLAVGVVAPSSDDLARRPRSRQAMLRYVAAHPDRLPVPLVAEQLRGTGKPGFFDALATLTSYPLRDRLDKITAPTLVVWGAADRLVPVRDAWEFGRLIDRARVVVYEDTGHVPMLERPDAFNALVAEFLQE